MDLSSASHTHVQLKKCMYKSCGNLPFSKGRDACPCSRVVMFAYFLKLGSEIRSIFVTPLPGLVFFDGLQAVWCPTCLFSFKVEQLLFLIAEGTSFATLYSCSYVDNSQGAADVSRTNMLLSMLHKRIMPVAEELEPVLSAFDASKVRGRPCQRSYNGEGLC